VAPFCLIFYLAGAFLFPFSFFFSSYIFCYPRNPSVDVSFLANDELRMSYEWNGDKISEEIGGNWRKLTPRDL